MGIFISLIEGIQTLTDEFLMQITVDILAVNNFTERQ